MEEVKEQVMQKYQTEKLVNQTPVNMSSPSSSSVPNQPPNAPIDTLITAQGVVKGQLLVTSLTEYTTPFDKNGVLYHIATKGGTIDYQNPHLSGLVVANMSSVSGSSTTQVTLN